MPSGIIFSNKLKGKKICAVHVSDIEVLKVGHHGGPNVVDEEMIKRLGIRTSLISTGINYFGHPNKGTLDVLRNTNILRTDFLNAIRITSSGDNYKIYSYEPQNKKFILKEELSSN